MSDSVRPVMERLFDALHARDKAGALDVIAEDAVFIDPHYPNPTMRGRAEISAGLDWSLSMMERFGFRIVNHFVSADGKDVAAFEVDTNHRLKAGRDLSFPQVFVTEVSDGKITKMQAYEPYGPNGLGGAFLGFERLKRRLFRR